MALILLHKRHLLLKKKRLVVATSVGHQKVTPVSVLPKEIGRVFLVTGRGSFGNQATDPNFIRMPPSVGQKNVSAYVTSSILHKYQLNTSLQSD